MAFERKLMHGSGEVPVLGAIFMCNRATKEMCFSWNTFGLPYSESSFVKQVKAGMFLFLFEYETRKLYGVYQACSDGTVNFKSAAFRSAGKQFPAQVEFRDIWYCDPLSEDEFRPAIEDNYYKKYKFKFGLSKNQVWELLKLFKSKKIGDALLDDSYLIPGPTRSPVQNQNILENVYSPKLEKFSPRNKEVRGRLLIEDDRDHANAVVDTALPKYKRDFSPDMMDYGCKPKKDQSLNYGVPYIPKDEEYDPEAPLLNDITAIQHLQRCREEWNERAHTENAVDGRPDFKVSEVESVTHQNHSSSVMQFTVCDNRLDPLSQSCNSTPNTLESTKVCVEMQSITPKKLSVFSRLKPALDADEGCKLEDPERSINDMVNEVMETLKGHYCQLVSRSNLAMNEVSDDDDNKSVFKKSQIWQSQAVKYEPPVDLSTSCARRQINSGSPRLTFKRRSEVHKTSPAEGEFSSVVLEEKQCKRRKLVRPSSEKNKSNKDDMADQVSENFSLSGQPIQDKSINTNVTLPSNEEQNPLEGESLGSLLLATSAGCSGQSMSSNLTDGIADISMGSKSEKHQIQPFSPPFASDAQHLAKQCNIGSVLLDVSLDGKSSQSAALNREDSEEAELSLALGSKNQKDGHAMLENIKVESPQKSAPDHVKEMSDNNEFGMLKDCDLSVDEESINCTLQLNFTMLSGDKKPGNTVVGCDMNGEEESGDIADLGVSTEMDLGGGKHVYAAQMPDNGSDKLVELDGGEEELLGRDNVHEEAMSNNLLAERIPANCQANEVCYFEFLAK